MKKLLHINSMKALRRFSYHQIKNHKKTVKYAFTVFVITFTLNLLLITLFSYFSTLRQQAFDKYGEWESALTYPSKEHERFLKQHQDIQSYTYTMADITMKEKDDSYTYLGGIAGIDDDAKTLFHLELLSGQMPEKDNEIAVEATVLSLLGMDYTLGRTITLPIQAGEYKDFILCGIIKPYRHQWAFPNQEQLPSAFVKSKKGERIL